MAKKSGSGNSGETSKKVATVASNLLRNKNTAPATKKVAASALSQAPNKPKNKK
jgi:hypothetical protein